MMFLDYLDRIREKPRAARERFVMLWSFLITGSIVLVWLSVLVGGAARPQQAAAPVESEPGFAASVMGSFRESMASLQGEVGIPGNPAPETRNPEDLPPLQNTWQATEESMQEHTPRQEAAEEPTEMPAEPLQAPVQDPTQNSPYPQDTTATPETAPLQDGDFIGTIISEVDHNEHPADTNEHASGE